MNANYDRSSDVLCLRLADSPVVRDVSYGWHVVVGYSADERPAEITIVDVSSLLASRNEDDEQTIVLTERESRRLTELLEHPPPRNENFVKAMAQHREMLSQQEPSIDNDAYAWSTHQIDILRKGRLNEVQAEALARYFEEQTRLRLSDLCALLRRILIDLRRLKHEPSNSMVIAQLAQFRARAASELELAPSLRSAAHASIDTVWKEARRALKYRFSGEIYLLAAPENCPYTIDEILGDLVPEVAKPDTEVRDDASGETATIISHITPVGANIFLDLGFSPEEAERLKEESDRRIGRGKANGASQV